MTEKELFVPLVCSKERPVIRGIVKARRNIRAMLWAYFIYEFNKKFFNLIALSAQQTEFLNFKQDSMTVAKAVKKFKRLAKLYPYLVSTEECKQK